MKNTRYILLIIGILGIAAGIYGAFTGQELINYMTGLVCGSSLIYGYFELGKKVKNE